MSMVTHDRLEVKKNAFLGAHIFKLKAATPDLTPDYDYVASGHHAYPHWALQYVLFLGKVASIQGHAKTQGQHLARKCGIVQYFLGGPNFETT